MKQKASPDASPDGNEPVESSGDDSELSLGSLLTREREYRHLSTEFIALQLKISESYIKAIESNDFHTLPGTTFAQGYIRAYARLLHIDEYSMDKKIQQALQPLPTGDFFISGMPKHRKKPSFPMLFTSACVTIICIIISLACTWFYHLHSVNQHTLSTGASHNAPQLLSNSRQPDGAQNMSKMPVPSGSKSLSNTEDETYPLKSIYSVGPEKVVTN